MENNNKEVSKKSSQNLSPQEPELIKQEDKKNLLSKLKLLRKKKLVFGLSITLFLFVVIFISFIQYGVTHIKDVSSVKTTPSNDHVEQNPQPSRQNISYEPYAKLNLTNGVLSDLQGKILIKDIPKSIQAGIIGPDGSTLYLPGNEFTGCLVDLKNLISIPSNYSDLDKSTTKCSPLGSSKDEEGPFAVLVKSVNENVGFENFEHIDFFENGEIIKFDIANKLNKDTSIKNYILEEEEKFRFRPLKSKNLYYQFSPGYPPFTFTKVYGDNRYGFSFFEDIAYFLDFQKYEASQIIIIPDEFPISDIRRVYFHPLKRIAIVWSSWEGPAQASYIIDFSTNHVSVITIPENMSIIPNNSFDWYFSEYPWRYRSDMRWTNSGIEFLINDWKRIYDEVTNKERNEACLEHSSNNEDDNPLAVEFNKKEEQTLASQYDVGDVICYLCYSGPYEGYGCDGLIERTFYKFDVGDEIFKEINKQTWSGNQL
jgi:hypothetical protein